MADPATLIASWLTPSSLFILVNLVIGTIAITSRLTAQKTEQTSPTQPQLHRSPSLLDRVRSFNLRNYEPTQPESTQPQLVRTPSLLLERVRSFNFSLYKSQSAPAETEHIQPEPGISCSDGPDPKFEKLVRTPSLLERVRSMNFSRLHRSESMRGAGEDPDLDPKPGGDSGNGEMKKSACKGEEEEEGTVERRRPATAAARIETTAEDEEVDARADDFINRFKKQLRLQRMDSILRRRRC